MFTKLENSFEKPLFAVIDQLKDFKGSDGKGIDYKNIFEVFPEVQFYDYTKIHSRSNIPENYDLTFSFSGYNFQDCISALHNNVRVAVVFNQLPEKFWGYKVIDGDKYDMRYHDKKNVIVGLKFKRVRNKLNKNHKFVVQL